MRRFSHVLSFLAVALFLLLAGSVAKANTIDPAIGVQGNGTGSTLWTGSLVVVFQPTTAGVTCDTSGMCNYNTPTSNPFFIETGSITSFEYSFNQSQNTGFSTAAGNQFPILFIQNDVNTANPIAFLSGGTILPSSPILFLATTSNTIVGDFLLASDGVVQGTIETITSNVAPAPEPGTIILLASGLGAFGLRRLRRNKTAA